jgi:dipeptidyl aminopeptidase/acylaminoacyl peptidase
MRRILCRAILLSFAFTAALQAQKRPITEKDLFDFHWIGDTQLSPDAHTVAFVETTVTPDHSGYQTALYTLDLTTPAATPKLLTPGTHDSSPRWSPDGTHIAFLRAVEKDGHPTPPQLYLTSPAGASPIRLSDLPKGASSPQWAPNGAALTVLSSTPQDQPKAKLEAAEKARATGDAAHISDIKIIDRVTWRFNGEGVLDPSFVPHLYMIYLPKADGTQDPPWQLTSGRFGVQDYLWRPGTNWLLYSSTHVDEPIYETFRRNTLFAIEAPTGIHPKEVPAPAATLDPKLEANGLAISPDGEHLAFHAAAEGPAPISHQETDLWIMDLKWSKNSVSATPAHNLTEAKGYEMGSGVGGDNTAPRGGGRPNILWSPDSKALLDVAGHQGSELLMQVDAQSGALTRLTAPKQSVLTFVASPDLQTEVALISNPILIGDLFRIGQPAPGATERNPLGAQTQLTHINEELFAKLDIAMPQELHVPPTVHPQDIPFVTIDTFVMLPPGYDPASKKPLPAILNIHGGPHSAYGWVFDQEMLTMAARGYVVDYPNPRGSTTYGQNFATIIQNNYPGDDFHDLMDTVDALIAKGWADPAKLGVTGGSGGGLLTDWVVTQTTRFKAAVAQRDITDWANWWYTADVAGFHQSFYPASPPFDHVELYRAHSPITFVNNIKTPMMFILGDVDYRTPPGSGGEDFFRALKYKCIPTVMVRFPRESHELSRSGEPWHRIERLENITAWFDKFLLNKPEPQYDVAPGGTPCTAPTPTTEQRIGPSAH